MYHILMQGLATRIANVDRMDTVLRMKAHQVAGSAHVTMNTNYQVPNIAACTKANFTFLKILFRFRISEIDHGQME